MCGKPTESRELAEKSNWKYFLPDNYTSGGAGGWGGFCTCPNGQRYGVGDNNNNCTSLACEGGSPSQCSKHVSSEWANKRVVCGNATTKEKAEKAKQFFLPDTVISGAAAQSGGYGGFCTSKEDMNPPPCGV